MFSMTITNNYYSFIKLLWSISSLTQDASVDNPISFLTLFLALIILKYGFYFFDLSWIPMWFLHYKIEHSHNL